MNVALVVPALLVFNTAKVHNNAHLTLRMSFRDTKKKVRSGALDCRYAFVVNIAAAYIAVHSNSLHSKARL